MPRKRDKLGDEISEMIEASVLDKARQKLASKAELPDGVITILFTDVEGSSELVRDHGDAQARAMLRRHDELVRRVLKEHDGIEVERAGDARGATSAGRCSAPLGSPNSGTGARSSPPKRPRCSPRAAPGIGSPTWGRKSWTDWAAVTTCSRSWPSNRRLRRGAAPTAAGTGAPGSAWR